MQVVRCRIGGQALAALGAVEAAAEDPAAAQLVVAGDVKAEGLDAGWRGVGEQRESASGDVVPETLVRAQMNSLRATKE